MKTFVVMGALVLATGTAMGSTPALFRGVALESSDGVIAVTWGHATPEVADWNDDGRQDLVVGQFASGKVRAYLNTGSPHMPAFSTFAYLKSNGSDITTSYG